MTIKTRSKFYYDFTATGSLRDLVFNEGSGDITATIKIGQYAPTKLALEVARAMTAIGTQDYFCIFNREERTFTISAFANFDLKVSSGVTTASIFPLLGFTGGDILAVLNATSDSATGKVFTPQFILQEYVDFEDDEGFSFATTKKTAVGEVEVVSFGSESFAQFSISFQTNIPQIIGSELLNDPNGVSNMREFFRYAIRKGSIEFMKNSNDVNDFTECILESTQKSKDGTAYRLNELYNKGLIDYFDSGLIKLRKKL